MKISQIIFFTRPWQADLHIALAKKLTAELGCNSVKFLTFFSLAVEKVEGAGFDCIYMPDELRKVNGSEISDEYFSEIDRKLYESGGENFHLMLQSERFLPANRGEALLFGKKHLAALDSHIGEGSLLISTVPDHFVYWLAGGLARIKKGAFFSFSACGLPPGRIMALKSMWKTWSVQYKGDIKAYFDACRARLMTPVSPEAGGIEYLKPQELPPLIKRLKHRYHEIKCEERDTKAGSYFPGSKIFSFQVIKNRLPKKWFKYPEPNYDITTDEEVTQCGPFCYVPLHMEPEATILMWSPWLQDQIEMCRLISQALPVGWKLLVKENNAMSGIRHPSFYGNLKQLPNLELVSPDVGSLHLNINSRVTASLSGTACLEASLMGKPAISFGRPPGLSLLMEADLSSSLKLSTLFQSLQQNKFQISESSWSDWIEGTFEGKIVPRFKPNGEFCTPDDAKNIEAYSEYIINALNQNIN